jgi:hypothetical protein
MWRSFSTTAFLGRHRAGGGALLLVLQAWLCGRHQGRACAGLPARARPAGDVLIPAFNEEKVFVTTIERILASDYPNLDVLVIDDGSKDHTAYIPAPISDEKRVGCCPFPMAARPMP